MHHVYDFQWYQLLTKLTRKICSLDCRAFICNEKKQACIGKSRNKRMRIQVWLKKKITDADQTVPRYGSGGHDRPYSKKKPRSMLFVKKKDPDPIFFGQNLDPYLPLWSGQKGSLFILTLRDNRLLKIYRKKYNLVKPGRSRGGGGGVGQETHNRLLNCVFMKILLLKYYSKCNATQTIQLYTYIYNIHVYLFYVFFSFYLNAKTNVFRLKLQL